MSELVYSGGASGADELWVKCALEHGCAVEIATFEGHRRTAPEQSRLNILSQEDLLAVKGIVLSVGESLGRRIDQRPFVYNLIARNYYIVKDAQAIYAVGYLNQSKGLGIDGGTAWGCEYFKDLRGVGTVLYFFDMTSSKWLMLQVLPDGGHLWLEHASIPSPKSYGKVALIGSRELTPEGAAAISQVWAE